MAQHRLKSTRQRETIIKTFLATDSHMSIDQLLLLSQQRLAGIGYATVYRTLKLLVDAGVAEARRFGDGQTRYEYHPPGSHHDHLICQSCGTIREFHDEELEALQEAIAKRFGFEIRDHKHEIYGVCADC
jgi:Fur family ferric uptake transcriptional regulator